MKPITRLRVVAVDLDGFTGREHHPRATDAGTVVHVHGMHLEPLDPEDPDPDSVISVWSCQREDGSLIDLVDHEVEIEQ